MRIRSLVLLALVVLLPAAPALAEPVPAGYTYSDEWLESFDGTQLHAGVFLPKDRTAGERHPIIMVPGPYTSPNGGVVTGTASNTSGPVIRFPELFEQKPFKTGRYGYVQLDVRGFGGAGGCYEYYGPNEAKDVAIGTTWASKRDWSTGKIALWGKSYDAADALLGVAERAEGLAAAVIQSPGLSAYTALWMNGVHYATGRYATTATYTADDLGPAQNGDYLTSPEYAQSNLAPVTSLPDNPTCRSDALVGMNAFGDRNDPFWADREPYKKAIGAKTPVLWSHGFYDANTKPVHMDIWSGLAGPKYAWFGGYTHVRGHEAGVGRKGFLEQAFRFLDTYVRGVDAGIEADPLVTVQQADPSGKWRLEQQWPPADAEPWAMPVRAGTYSDQPGTTAYALPSNGTWSITGALPGNAHLAGEAKLDVPVTTVAPGAHLTALLYDLDETGKATFVQRGAMALAGTGAQRATFTLYPQDYRFAKGHRIALLITEGDDDWFSPGVTGTPVTVGAGTLALPLLRTARTMFVTGGKSDGMRANSFTVPAATIAGSAVGGTPPPQR
jgi:hypothetical protein